MLDLIERLEKATGPDRDLDAAIRVRVLKGAFPDETIEQRLEYSRRYGQHYTESIDDALTLVPRGYCADVQTHVRGSAIFDKRRSWAQVEEIDGPAIEYAYAATAPIALCIAALKARVPLTSGERE